MSQRRCARRAHVPIGLLAADYVWTGLAPRLPSAFATRYDRDFHRRMLGLVMSLQDELAAGTFVEPRCTAEEILLAEAIRRINAG